MAIKLKFCGGTRTVTGSMHLIKTDSSQVLLDCGLFQGPGHLRQRNWEKPSFDPATVSAVALTHAHIDHMGYLPRLVRHGFRGKVFATAPTTDLAGISLLDSAKIQEEDAAYKKKRHLREGRQV